MIGGRYSEKCEQETVCNDAGRELICDSGALYVYCHDILPEGGE